MKLRAVNWLPHLQLYQHGCSVTYTVNQHKSILVVQKITTEKHSSAYTCVSLCVISGLWGYGSRFLSLSIVINSMSWWWLVSGKINTISIWCCLFVSYTPREALDHQNTKHTMITDHQKKEKKDEVYIPYYCSGSVHTVVNRHRQHHLTD